MNQETPEQIRLRIAEVGAELESARRAATPERNPGCSKLRGKQHGIRIDASIRRTAQGLDRVRRLEQELAGLRAQRQRAEQVPVDPDALQGARFVFDAKFQEWREVARVNKTTVSVTTGHSWTDRIPHSRIVAVSGGECR